MVVVGHGHGHGLQHLGLPGPGHGVATGATTITATSGLISGTAVLTVTPAVLVSITVSPATASVAAGDTQQFTATGTYSDLSTADLTDSVTWSSSVTATATVSNTSGSQGLATGVATGADHHHRQRSLGHPVGDGRPHRHPGRARAFSDHDALIRTKADLGPRPGRQLCARSIGHGHVCVEEVQHRSV